jgi:signal transduction histidine kinase
MLYFSVIVVGLVLALVLFINSDNSKQVNEYMLHGGMYGYQEIVRKAENYYRINGSWDGIESIAANFQPTMMGGSMNMGMNMNTGPGKNGEFTIIDTNRVVVWSSAGNEVGSTMDESVLENAITLSIAPQKVVGYLIVNNRQVVQATEVSPLIEKLRAVVLRSGLIVGILALILAILLANQLIKPVRLLTQAADSLAGGKLSTRVKVKGQDEIAHLGMSFNTMAENLESAESRKKAMTADIAHELRSPLAVQKAQLEAMQDGIVPITQENLQTVVEQTNFLTRLVDDLRTLALVDAGELTLEMQEVDFLSLISKVVERFKPQADQQKVELEFVNAAKTEVINVKADPDRMTQILGNLIANALHHTPAGGRIKIDLKKNGGQVIVSVRDHGCGIPDDDLPHLFERFYRGDKSRNRQDSGSTGLGLSIARNLARVHGGDLTAENAEGGGALFILTLPG